MTAIKVFAGTHQFFLFINIFIVNIAEDSNKKEIMKIMNGGKMEYSEIIYTEKDPVASITLNNPSKVNSLSIRMVSELSDILSKLPDRENIRVVIIKAVGKHFCAGHYLPEMIDKGVKKYREIFSHCSEMMKMIHEIPQPVIAQVQGVATAAGCQLAAWCDLVVAEEGAKFATPGVRIGLFCTTPGVAVVRAVGRKAAMEMLLTGRYYSAGEAKELGLVNRVVPPEELETATELLALEIAEASRFAIALGKKAFYNQVDRPDENAYDSALDTMALNLASEDAQTGIKAFLEKKTPEWKNR